MDLPRVIGHRGAAAHAPENTIAGIRRAAALGVAWVEFDTKITADDQCIVFHDDKLDRTTDGRGKVADTRYDDIRRLDAGSWFDDAFADEPIPRLDALLDTVARLGMHPDIEIKATPGRDHETAARVVEEARATWPAERPPPLVTSFSVDSLLVARELAPTWPRGLVAFSRPRDWIDRLARLESRLFICRHDNITPAMVAEAEAISVRLAAFTVNEPARAVTLIDWGVSTIISDRPAAILAAIGDRSRGATGFSDGNAYTDADSGVSGSISIADTAKQGNEA